MDEVLGRKHQEPLSPQLTAAGALSLERVTRRYPGGGGIDDVSLSVAPGELVALIGASGSGKTTTLRVAAGYEVPQSGSVSMDGRDITAVPAQRRGFGMVFQHYALFPHMNVEENVAFGLEARRVPRQTRLSRAREALASVGLSEVGPRPVQSLSGGEQQRVAVARALVIEPRALLLDEPLSNLDPTLRQAMRTELSAMLRRSGVPSLLVTHDQEDAFAIADRVALLSAGRLLQVGTPEDLYQRPVSGAVARFIGRGAVIPASSNGQMVTVTLAGVTVAAPLARGAHPDEGNALTLLRPESLRLANPDAGAWRGRIIARRFAGSATIYTVDLGGGTTVEVEARGTEGHPGDLVGVSFDGSPLPLFAA